MKTNIHIYKVWAASLALAGLTMAVTTACNETQSAPRQMEEEESHRVPVTLLAMQPGGGGEDGKPSTRLSYDDKLNEDGSGFVKMKWDKNDRLYVYTLKEDGTPNQKDNLSQEYLKTDGVTDANGMVTFKGEITPGHDDMIYCMYSDGAWTQSQNGNTFTKNYAATSTQDCKHPMKHLTKKDVLYASGKVGESLSFKRVTAMLRFVVTLPEAKSVVKLNLKGTGNPFASQANLTLSESGWKPDESRSSRKDITLSLTNHQAGTEVIGYAMIYPRTSVSRQTLTLTLTATDDTKYQSEITIPSTMAWEPGKCYTIKTTVQGVK